MEINIKDIAHINKAAQTFVEHIGNHRVFAFYGSMVTSPTFAIVNEYTSLTTGDPIFHFDFYRIKKLEEVYDMGYEEYFYSGGLCFIEWPELVEGLLPEDALKVNITTNDDGSRTIKM